MKTKASMDLDITVTADEFALLESGEKHFIAKRASRTMRERLFEADGNAKKFDSARIAMTDGKTITGERPRIYHTTMGELVPAITLKIRSK